MTQNRYMCDECGARFNSQEELEKHKRALHIHHRCEVCGRSFRMESDLESHYQTAHPEREGIPDR